MFPRNFQIRDGSQVVVREADADDAAAVLAYLEEVAAETNFISFGPGEFGKSLEEETAALRTIREQPHRLYLLALVDKQIVSSLNFAAGERPRIRHCGEFGLTVRRRWWGYGIGSRMLDALLEWARSTGFLRKINLRVRSDNRRAIALYERKGFLVEGMIRGDFRVDGVDYDHLCMGLRISR